MAENDIEELPPELIARMGLRPPTLGPRAAIPVMSAPSLPNAPRPGLNPATLDLGNGGANLRTAPPAPLSGALPDPRDPRYNPGPRTGVLARVGEVGAGLLGGLGAAHDYINAPQVKAQQRFAQDTQFAKDTNAQEDVQAQEAQRTAAANKSNAQASELDMDSVDVPGVGPVPIERKHAEAFRAALLHAQSDQDIQAAHDNAREQIDAANNAMRDSISSGKNATAVTLGEGRNATQKAVAGIRAGATEGAAQIRADQAGAKTGSAQQAQKEAFQQHARLANEAAKNPTGPGDYSIMMAFVDATKPSSGFRFTDAERKMILGARPAVEGMQARYTAAAKGPFLGDDQRKIMMGIVNSAAGGGGNALSSSGNTVIKYDGQGNRIK